MLFFLVYDGAGDTARKFVIKWQKNDYDKFGFDDFCNKKMYVVT